MTLTLHPLAEQEVSSAAAFYENKAAGLGIEFLDEVDRGLDLIEMNPDLGRVVTGSARRIVLHRFPYSLVYQSTDSDVHVIAVAHHSRRPGYWVSRIN